MYNQLQEQIAKQCAEQAASLRTNFNGSLSTGACCPAPDQTPISSTAGDLLAGLMELNARLRSLRAQMLGPEPEAAGCAKQSGPNSLIEALVLAGTELREAHAHVEKILNRL